MPYLFRLISHAIVNTVFFVFYFGFYPKKLQMVYSYLIINCLKIIKRIKKFEIVIK